MKILVTGATGFIGSHLVRALVRGGYDVTALARATSSLSYLPKKKIAVIYGDVRSEANMLAALEGFDAVFHNAALASDWAGRDEFYQTNVVGTRAVLKALRCHKIPRLILTSTIGVLGEEDCPAPKNEESPYKPRMDYFLSRVWESDMNHYRLTKTIAEQEAIAFCKQNNIALTVIRPAWVYGPREFHAGPFSLCQAVLAGVPAMPIGSTNRFHVVYVEDLAEAMVSALRRNFSGIKIFIIGAHEPPLMKDYFNALCSTLGARPRFIFPRFVFRILGFCLEFTYKLFKIKRTPLLTRARANMFYCNNVYDVSRAQQELGFTAATPLEQGIAKTVRWWRLNGFLEIKQKPPRA